MRSVISQADKEQFRLHAKNCCDLSEIRTNPYEADPDVILRFWEENKQRYLYKLLGEEVILTRHITYNKAPVELQNEMSNMCHRNHAFIHNLLETLDLATKPAWDDFYHTAPKNNAARFYTTVRDMLQVENLIDGRVPISVSNVIMGKEIQLTYGQKSMRAIGRIAGLLGMSEAFEDFRIAHSQVLNQRTISGDLHLSIHPLDYATASDNANGWSSCMSWQEQGCYRLGTVEMMNSPMVICAYLTGRNTLHDIGDKDWNSKKWRAWAIVNKDVILVNRQYPYDNDSLATMVIDWIKQLAKDNLDWEYQDTKKEFRYCDYGMTFSTNYMYNDTTNGMPGAPGIHMEETSYDVHKYNFSGPAVCMWCGEEIPYDGNSEDAGTLCCHKCRDGYTCSCCGDSLNASDVCWGPDDMPYCNDCYSENFSTCDHCDEVRNTFDSMYTLEMGVDLTLLTNLVKKEGKESAAYKKYRQYWWGSVNEELSYPDCFRTNICETCLSDYGIHPEHLLYLVPMPYEFYIRSWDQSYMRVNTLDPTKVTFDQANDVFNFYRDYEDSDGSLERIWKTMWTNHIANLVKQGSINL